MARQNSTAKWHGKMARQNGMAKMGWRENPKIAKKLALMGYSKNLTNQY